MDTPTIIYYEHDFQDSQVTSLAKSVLNLGNECRALAEENARLKTEVERLDTLCKQVMAQHSDISCENITLRKVGDAMAEELIGRYFGNRLATEWNAAKEGKQS